MSILVLGTVALDTVKTPFGERAQMLGGSAAHFSMSARLFTDVHLVAVVGDDFPKKHLVFLRAKGVNVDSVVHCQGKSFQWSGEYRGDMNSANTLHTELGVLSTFTPKITDEQKKIPYLFLANVDPDIQRGLIGMMRSPDLVALDSMNFWIHHKRDALLRTLSQVDLYVANDQEARDLSGESNCINAAKYLSSLGPKMILIKKGEHGVLFYSKEYICLLPAFPTDIVIDPTGAGDTFAGGFMGYLAQARKVNQATIKRAIAFGTAAASCNVEGFGVEKTSKITRKILDGRLARLKKALAL
jgi:sugar/nucleoside kinase (ribokinase family)